MDITLAQWNEFSSDEREHFARRLARQLPLGFTYHSLYTYPTGSEQRQTARFQFQAATFMLIPGGTLRLGYDANHPWKPTPQERQSWQQTSAEYGFTHSIQDYVAQVTLRPRMVTLRPFLAEAQAYEVGWEPVAADDPSVEEIVKKYFHPVASPGGMAELQLGNSRIRIQGSEDGRPIVQRAQRPTHQALHQALSQTGFRFPTSDEWEYLCGGGRTTLFHWGDHAPGDRYPTDISPAEAAWRRRWVLSLGKLKRPAAGFAPDWDLHRRPNGFGLYIASNPYHYELVAEPDKTRGGDGGSLICGGAGFFVGWLTLATAYFEAHCCVRDPYSPILVGYTIGRRVFPLG